MSLKPTFLNASISLVPLIAALPVSEPRAMCATSPEFFDHQNCAATLGR